MKRLLLLFCLLLMNEGYANITPDFIEIPANEKLELPLPLPYERKEISSNELISFINDSKKGKQPLIIFGANWCPDCRTLEGTLQLPTVKKYMQENYSILHVDLGTYDINMSLLEVLGIPKQEGVPRVVIFDHKGKPLNLETNDRWRTARDSKQQEIFNYFQKHLLKP